MKIEYRTHYEQHGGLSAQGMKRIAFFSAIDEMMDARTQTRLLLFIEDMEDFFIRLELPREIAQKAAAEFVGECVMKKATRHTPIGRSAE